MCQVKVLQTSCFLRLAFSLQTLIDVDATKAEVALDFWVGELLSFRKWNESLTYYRDLEIRHNAKLRVTAVQRLHCDVP